ncbi:hypothetical protein PR048_018681 [Dryococelus australis]|uniref:DNA helicase Pif1-like 2B domain-containing protein n=1 Tax=Dryococelus australis TaxID=614101 RepID=A0ABQ9HD03_9NEOP|nr:hypothetical protein PR048_018681 [Dryococelus australis]
MMHPLNVSQNNCGILGMGKWQSMNPHNVSHFQQNFCKITATTDELILKVSPNIAQNFKCHQWLSECAILAAKNNYVNTINFSIQNEIPDEATTYEFIDAVINQDEVVNYPTEFLNSLKLPGMPPHVLTWKIGVPIILL